MVAQVVRPGSLQELQDAVQGFDQVRVIGSGSRLGWCSPWEGPCISTSGLTGIAELRPNDFVVRAWAGTKVVDLLAELAAQNLTLPFAKDLPEEITQKYGTLGGLFSCGLPHGTEAQHGPVRDWILGVQVVRGNGDVAKAGSSVLKSVAGFDTQRFAVGARGALFAIAQVTLRLSPVAAVKMSSVEVRSSAIANWVVRLPKSKLVSWAESGPEVVAIDKLTGTAWCSAPVSTDEGWWMGPGGARTQTDMADLEASAKASFDPTGRFVGGW